MAESNNKQIAKNALALYFRMFFTMLVGLYTSRVILQALGVEDYGIYNVVGGFVSMFSLISGSVASSVSRFFTFELGRKDLDKLKRVFSTSIFVLIGLAIIVFIATETFGIWYLDNKMVIPESRMTAAMWCFQISLVTFVVNLINQPYSAAIIAHERMDIYAYLAVSDSVMKLIICYAVLHSPIDRLIFYAILLCGVGLINQAIYVIFCKRKFQECTFHLVFDCSLFKEMFGFAGWNFIGSSAAILTSQGSNLLLNWAGGPVVNAAYGIANTVSSIVSTFVANFTQAFTPQITKRYAAQEYDSLMQLLIYGSKYSYFLMFIIALPIMLTTEFLLNLWLGQVPEHAVWFVRFIILSNLFDVISRPVVNAKNATGRIRNYQIVVGGILLLVLPFSYVCIKFGLPVESVTAVAALISFVAVLARMYMLRGDFPSWSSRLFLQKVVIRVLFVSIITALVPIAAHIYTPKGWGNFLLTGSVSLISTILCFLYLGCDKVERQLIFSKCKQGIENFKGKFSK
ncbi:lipopolysaccharide biosynthesis protein [Bacteroides acidifaciens]|uniref:lipopolysaccharide biosynthesis protein n=1 Tax=Bacteroides acidifaciens TaxID=85831 RepID=UPI0030157E11